MLTRRTFLKTSAAFAGTTLAPTLTARGDVLSGSKLTTARQVQIEWQDCEIGVIFHLDMPMVAGDFTRNNATRKVFDPGLYNPTKLDTDQWVAAAKSAGAKYGIFTATHFNGFMQWQSDIYPYGCRQASWRAGKGDIVADFVASCRKMDILPGIYLSTHRNAQRSSPRRRLLRSGWSFKKRKPNRRSANWPSTTVPDTTADREVHY